MNLMYTYQKFRSERNNANDENRTAERPAKIVIGVAISVCLVLLIWLLVPTNIR